jgi:uncharacterized protein YaiL (DUF2058 family)
MVQKLTAKSWNEQKQFRPLVENSEIMNYLSKEDIDDAFDYHYHLRYVDDITYRQNIQKALNRGESYNKLHLHYIQYKWVAFLIQFHYNIY